MSPLRWLFVTAPARLYLRGEASGGRVPLLYVFAVVAVPALGALVGFLLERLAPSGVRMGLEIGFFVGCAAVVLWPLYALLLVVVLRRRERTPDRLVGEDWLRREPRWYER